MAGPENKYDDQDNLDHGAPPPSIDWADAMQESYGSTPWWVVSAIVHAVILGLLTFVVLAHLKDDPDPEIIPLDIARIDEEEDPEEIKERDIFENDKNIENPEIVETPILVTEETEISEEMETENNMDNNSARGQEDAISDVPLGGTGTVGHFGLGGGGGGAFGHRGGGGRRRRALRGGGSRASESSVNAALRWLARHQTEEGNWEIRRWDGICEEEATVGATGLALLAFLGAGHTEKTGQHKETVKKAVEYLISRQQGGGNITTATGAKAGGGYNQAIAGLALAEAYGMAQVEATRQAAQKLVGYSLNTHQHSSGGWRYNPGREADTSVTGWYVMLLKSAIVAGLDVPDNAFDKAEKFIDSVSNDSGLCSYVPGSNSYQPMTAVGMLCRQFMGKTPLDSQLLTGAADSLLTRLPSWTTGTGDKYDFYYWYYGTLVMFQMGGDWWKKWNASIRDMLVQHQHNTPQNPELDGSWDPVGHTPHYGGRAVSTALGALTLEVYYRYLPIYK